MLKIVVKGHSPQEVILSAIGWVSGANVLYLKREMERWKDETPRLILELADVRAIDEAGLTLLRDWSGPPLVLRCDSAFLRRLLEQEGFELDASD